MQKVNKRLGDKKIPPAVMKMISLAIKNAKSFENIVIGFGAVISVISFCGCVGACCSIKLLKLYRMFMLIFIVIIAGGGYWADTQTGSLMPMVTEQLTKMFTHFDKPGAQKLINVFQVQGRCCGVLGPDEWASDENFMKTLNSAHGSYPVPDSCCTPKFYQNGCGLSNGNDFVEEKKKYIEDISILKPNKPKGGSGGSSTAHKDHFEQMLADMEAEREKYKEQHKEFEKGALKEFYIKGPTNPNEMYEMDYGSGSGDYEYDYYDYSGDYADYYEDYYSYNATKEMEKYMQSTVRPPMRPPGMPPNSIHPMHHGGGPPGMPPMGHPPGMGGPPGMPPMNGPPGMNGGTGGGGPPGMPPMGPPGMGGPPGMPPMNG